MLINSNFEPSYKKSNIGINRMCILIRKLIEYSCLKETWKLSPGWFPPDNSHQQNPHQRKFPPMITPIRKIPTKDNSYPDNSHSENCHSGWLPPGQFPPRTIPTPKIATQLISTPGNCNPRNLTKFSNI